MVEGKTFTLVTARRGSLKARMHRMGRAVRIDATPKSGNGPADFLGSRMGEPWIKLRIHAEHPKVLRISALTKLPKETVFAMAVRWFRHVDAYLPDDSCVIDAAGINAVVQFRADANKGQDEMTFVRGLLDEHVQWLSDAHDGGYRIPEYDKHFSANAKRRGEEALRKKNKRASAKRPHKSGQKSASLSISSLSSSESLTKQEDAKYAPRKQIPPPHADWVAYGVEIGLSAAEARSSFDYWESVGWKRRTGRVQDWQATLRTRKAQLDSNNGKSPGNGLAAKSASEASTDAAFAALEARGAFNRDK